MFGRREASAERCHTTNAEARVAEAPDAIASQPNASLWRGRSCPRSFSDRNRSATIGLAGYAAATPR